MTRMHLYLRKRVEEVKERYRYEIYEMQKLPSWERFVLTWVTLMAFWLGISCDLSYRGVTLGAITTAIISFYLRDFLTDDVRHSKHLAWKILYFALIYFPQYLMIMAFRLLESNIKVARHAILMDINPGIVKIKTTLHSDTGITILANSITLTPGTLTIDVAKKLDGTYLYVHWIDVETLNVERAGELIKGDIEEWLKKVFW
ncbi:monovalent cation/H+ antiporter subunit E [Pyrococcus abyssi]|uniref:Multisubunit Na+/H+ antiporter, putative n=1 Tax=Pyrococcus abyssi (strain GE5 / Orsay) TaxID=272844 RepID=Q9UZE6_PYRAB|nr:monovalent cation/H+ antiporter subunit E [Pyrococcus abyssi]CAB50113.1 Multisubunit Na+/H+ antiporter, putative [Pyrococcus abyssi GE5]CCE70637.1 TPA: putative monovalent cation/H+ antiporter subunit E [Pyrococcus abyssi GE5]